MGIHARQRTRPAAACYGQSGLAPGGLGPRAWSFDLRNPGLWRAWTRSVIEQQGEHPRVESISSAARGDYPDPAGPASPGILNLVVGNLSAGSSGAGSSSQGGG
jgi:hypothetical protein